MKEIVKEACVKDIFHVRNEHNNGNHKENEDEENRNRNELKIDIVR